MAHPRHAELRGQRPEGEAETGMDGNTRLPREINSSAPAEGSRLAAIKAAVLDAGTYAAGMQAEGRADAIEGCYTAFHLTIWNMLQVEPYRHGWQKAAMLATDLRTRQVLDTLAPSRLETLQLRASALLDLPELMVLQSLEEMQLATATAINLGAPRYNDGDAVGCCLAYWATIQTLVFAPAMRGFPHYARALGLLRQVAEIDPPIFTLDAAAADEYAWTLRQALDAVLALQP
ncbi:MAG TPA: hypothetical protein VFU88_10115 [Ktedonobacterales bacterium]|nr:hypothetical protein [Ktedonobacterales bacterium]